LNKIVEVASRQLRILVAVDFSPESLGALKKVRALLRRVPAELTVTHVRPHSDVRAAVLEERGDLLRLPPGGIARGIAEHYRERFEEILQPGETFRLLSGEPAREICREGGKGYDLIAMGTRGRGGAATFLLGSTVQETLHRSRVPLIVVPHRR
jgi:nucleotide-binding universal stress UspA family protein